MAAASPTCAAGMDRALRRARQPCASLDAALASVDRSSGAPGSRPPGTPGSSWLMIALTPSVARPARACASRRSDTAARKLRNVARSRRQWTRHTGRIWIYASDRMRRTGVRLAPAQAAGPALPLLGGGAASRRRDRAGSHLPWLWTSGAALLTRIESRRSDA